MKLEFDIKDEALRRGFDGLSPAKLRTVFRTGTRKGMLVVRKQVVANYRKIWKGSNRYRAIWVKNYAKKSVVGAYVSLYSKRLNPSYDWGGKDPRLLRWLDLGTNERATKKGYNRGMVDDTGFFGKAVEAKMNQAEAVAVQSINEGIMKRARKEGFA